jgi:ribonuclease P protein component
VFGGQEGSAVRGESSSNNKIQFNLVYAEGKSWTGKEIIIRALPNKQNLSRFGFVVNRRIGNAVVRNRIKRLLREIVRHTSVKPGWDIVFIARVPAAVISFKDLDTSVRKLLFQAGLYVGENEENSPRVN